MTSPVKTARRDREEEADSASRLQPAAAGVYKGARLASLLAWYDQLRVQPTSAAPDVDRRTLEKLRALGYAQ